jgi:NAD(P)-dependent dehydrogenase (short-subunit alcohol dehydrogenase family)
VTADERVALVTGAGSGIGRAAALQLARDGCAVAFLDRDADAATAAAADAGAAATCAIAADVADADAVRDAVEEVASRLGTPTVLVNSAGILTHAPFVELDPADWRRVIDVNLTGTFLCTQAVVRRLVAEDRRGAVVNVASVHADSPGAGLAHYDASKGGLRMLTRSLALELAPAIRVNAVAPGLVMTNLGGGVPDEYRERLEQTIPLGRAGEPDEIAQAIAFLCSDAASYITGSMLVIDGGMLLTAET